MELLDLITHHARTLHDLANDRRPEMSPRDRWFYDQHRQRAVFFAGGDLKDAIRRARERGISEDAIAAAQERGGLS